MVKWRELEKIFRYLSVPLFMLQRFTEITGFNSNLVPETLYISHHKLLSSTSDYGSNTMNKTLSIFTIVLLASILLYPAVAASADPGMHGNDGGTDGDSGRGGGPMCDDNRNGVDDRREKDELRHLEYELTNDSVTVLSGGDLNEKENSFYFTVDMEGGLFLRYDYFRMAGCSEADEYHKGKCRGGRADESSPAGAQSEKGTLSSDMALSLEFTEMREFNQTDSHVSDYTFSTAEFENPVVMEIPFEDGGNGTGGNGISALEITTGTADGIFKLRIYIFTSYTRHMGMIVTPYEIKYDIIINDYPFRANDSMLALENTISMPMRGAMMDETYDERMGYAMKEHAVGYDNLSASMFFAWATNVTVDGEEHDVMAEYAWAVLGSGRVAETVTFIYPAGSNIVHDPKIGVSDSLEYVKEKAAEFLEMLVSWSTGLGVGLVAVAVVALKHRPKKYHWEE